MQNSNSNTQFVSQSGQSNGTATLLEPVSCGNGSAPKMAEHFAQFYEADAFLLDSLCDFSAAGLIAGEACIVVATPAHRDELAKRLQAAGLNLSVARASGQYITLDAAETLAKFMVDGLPEPRRFAEVVGEIIQQAAAAGNGRVRIFGEMVALLLAEGNSDATIRLEELWNGLQKTYPFKLFCAYPIGSFGSATLTESFAHVCANHSRVIPAESYTTLDEPADRLQRIVQLQQQASALQAEIEERKAVEARLRQSQRELNDFVENAVVGLHWVGPDGIILWANRAEMNLLGYSREEYIGRHITEFHADPPVIKDILHCLAKGQEIRSYEARLRCKDGSIKQVLIDSNVYFENGQFVHTRCFTRDVTEHRQAEQALRQNEERMRQLLALLPAAVYTCDSEGLLTYYNQRAAQLWGREPKLADTGEKFCGSYRLRYLDGTPLANADTPMADAVKTGKVTRDQEVVMVRPDGSEVIVSVNIDPLFDPAGQRCGAVNVFQDISTRKRAEEELTQANLRKDEFLAMLAHELRNPLAPIRSAVELLRRLGPSTPPLQQARDIIDRQTHHLTRLIDDLLDTARITQGKITLQLETLELMNVIGRALETSRPIIESRRHQLSISLPQEPIRLAGDLERLAQVISNLLNNAAKYTPEGGHISLTAESIGTEISLRVRDNGKGIPATLLPYIFDLFTQAEQSLDRTEGGLGIGLALVRNLVELHGGRVEAYSAGPEQGSEFIFHLPRLENMVRKTEAALNISAEAVSYPKACRRILVVDDNVDSAECMALIFTLGGHEVQIAYDGPAALDIARTFQPQVVLLDIGLPKIDGYEVARRLREWPEMQNAVLIALTGYGRAEDRRLSEQAGFDHHLTKPVNPDTVESLVNSLVLA